MELPIQVELEGKITAQLGVLCKRVVALSDRSFAKATPDGSHSTRSEAAYQRRRALSISLADLQGRMRDASSSLTA